MSGCAVVHVLGAWLNVYIIITAMAAENPVLAQSMPMRTASLAVINNKIIQGWLVFCLLLFSVKSSLLHQKRLARLCNATPLNEYWSHGVPDWTKR